MLVAVELELDGPLVDLTDVPTRQELEDRHLDLLLAHGLQHLDLHEITTSRRTITQTIAADLYDRGASAVRSPPGWTATRASRCSKAEAPPA